MPAILMHRAVRAKGADAGTAPAWFTALAEKTWTQIAGGDAYGDAFQNGATLISQDSATAGISATGGFNSIVKSWTGGCVNQDQKEFLFVANGGHGDYWGNEAIALKLNQAVPAWQLLADPTPTTGFATNPPCDAYGLAPARYADNRPSSMHTSNLPCYGNGQVWIPAQSAYSNIGGNNLSVFSWDRSSLGADPVSSVAWSNDAGLWTYHGTATGTTQGFNGAAYDSIGGKVWTVGGENDTKFYYSVDATTGTIANYSQSLPGSHFGSVSVAVATDLRLLVATDYNSGNFYVMDLTNPGAGFAAKAVTGLTSGRYAWGMVYHQASKSLLLFNGATHTTGQIIKVRIPTTGDSYDAAGTWASSTVTKAGGVNPTEQYAIAGGTYSKFNIVNDMGGGQACLVLVDGTAAGHTYVYKLPTTEIS